MKRVIGGVVCSFLLTIPSIPGRAENSTPVWKNPDQPLPERVEDLMVRLSESQKISFLNWLTPGMTNLGIAPYGLGNECLHGLVRPGENTIFPQAIGLGATFDPAGIHAMSTAISDEARAHWNETGGVFQQLNYPLILWSPVVNLARDPRWGRTQETYGEDPWLTSRLGVAFVKGLQGDDPKYIKVVATPKHFAANNKESGRFGCNITCDERFLFEYELYPFRACVEEGKASSIMASYTSINGIPSVSNPLLLKEVLRKRWGFRGFVVSDCGAISNQVDQHKYVRTPEEAIAASLNAGLDEEGGWYCKYRDIVNVYLPGALKQGLVTWGTVNNALRNILDVRFRLGLYDPQNLIPYSKIPPSVICSPEHVMLSRHLADESMVLLKNESVGDAPLLPINAAKASNILVLGPNADVVNLGDYSGKPKTSVSPLAGIRERAAREGIRVTYLPWQATNEEVVPETALLSPATDGNHKMPVAGLMGHYYNSTNTAVSPVATRTDRRINFDWAHIEPDALASGDKFSVVWEGKIRCTHPGEHIFTLDGDGIFSLKVNNQNLIAPQKEGSKTRRNVTKKTRFDSAGEYPVRIEYRHEGGETGLVFRWVPAPAHDDLSSLKNANLVVALMGLSTDDEIEGKDRKTLELPPEQQEFLRKALEVNPRLVMVTESGSPLVMPWAASNVPAIVQAWYPGQEGGRAIADILFGDVNPSGRLPLTFYASDAQLRPMDEYDLTKGRTYMYLREKPEYPFGHGLSYTTFAYSKARLSSQNINPGEKVQVTLDVTNSGSRDGEEVVQCYVQTPDAGVPMPIRQLWGFQRVCVPKGATKSVSIELDTANFGYWDKATQKFQIPDGTYDIQVGASSSDIRASIPLKITQSTETHP
jgi:beta-glucosidase